jgi:hypothetical protein
MSSGYLNILGIVQQCKDIVFTDDWANVILGAIPRKKKKRRVIKRKNLTPKLAYKT